MASFVDRVVLHVAGGDGGHGCTSIHREKFKPLAGPDGGDGGHGGSVILRVDPSVTTLLSYHRSPHRSAGSGTPGMGDWRRGENGADVILPVPEGTVVKDTDGSVIADLVEQGAQLVVAEGGAGGRGNFSLASSKRRAPGFHLLGLPGEKKDVVLELKSIADVALVGYPSAGKSSLIAAMSAARPKIADYPFTTLVPNLGVVEAGSSRYTIVHVLDAATLESDRDPLHDLEVIEAELATYSQRLADDGSATGRLPLMSRPRVIVVNKVDMPDGAAMAEMMHDELLERGWPVFEVSALTRKGLRELSYALADLVEQDRQQLQEAQSEPVRPVITPAPVGRRKNEPIATIKLVNHPQEGKVYQVRGQKPERWVLQTDFTNNEAVGYLADRLAIAGVEDELLKAGAQGGDTVLIGDLSDGVIFTWEPTLTAGAELLGQRGTDVRVEDYHRRTNEQRRAEYKERMDAKEAARAALREEAAQGLWTDPDL